MYVKGVGCTKFGTHQKTTQELCYEAVSEALDDAQMPLSEIDAIFLSKGDSAYDAERQKIFPSVVSSVLQKENIPILRVIAACSGGGAAVWNAVHSGYEKVLVIGVEKLTQPPTKHITDDLMMASERIYEQTEGLSFPAQNGLIAQQYMKKYNVTAEHLALVALKNHENAVYNQKAKFFNRPVTLQQIRQSPIVASPLRLFDCSISVDGAAAAVLTAGKTDIEIIGSALITDRLAAFEAPDMTCWEATQRAAQAAYLQAGITANDITFAELHDAFTSVELMSYEDLGFCKKGDGKKLISKGMTKLNGALPVNTGGGLKAKGHPVSATGVSQIYELATQMRKKAGKRQIEKTGIGLAHNVGGVGSSVTVHILQQQNK